MVRNYSSIVSFNQDALTEHIAFSYDFKTEPVSSFTNEPVFVLNPVIRIYEYRPRQLVQTVAEIGGLFVLFRLSIILLMAHEYVFHKGVAMRYGPDYRRIFSFEGIKRMLDTLSGHDSRIKRLEETIHAQN